MGIAAVAASQWPVLLVGRQPVCVLVCVFTFQPQQCAAILVAATAAEELEFYKIEGGGGVGGDATTSLY